MSEKEFREPEPSTTPEHRRKLYFLSVFAAVIIVLIWLASFPLNYSGRASDEPSAPAELINVIGDDIETSTEAIINAQPNNDTEQDTSSTNSSN